MSNLVLAFSGTHGSGKTTLAKLIAEKTGAQFITSSAGQIHRQFGVAAAENIPFDLRVEIQIAILNDWEESVARAAQEGPVATDRSPIDFAAYLLSEVPRSLDAALSASVMHFTEHCIERCRELSPILFCYPHGATVEDRGEDKAPADNTSYALSVHNLMTGLMINNSVPFLMLKDGDLAKRTLSVTSYLSDRFDAESSSKINGSLETWAPRFH